jgi:hypothetical protein
MAVYVLRLSLLAGVALLATAPALAQIGPGAAASTTGSAKRVYTPADFARFAPKTAYDMLSQVPSFTIQGVDTSNRGLGQASENVLINGQRISNKLGAVDLLQRTPASSVDRIEIVDASSLGIAGLSGQVANVLLKTSSKGTGQFRMGYELPFPFHRAGVSRRLGQLFEQVGAGRLHGLDTEQFRPRRHRWPGACL